MTRDQIPIPAAEIVMARLLGEVEPEERSATLDKVRDAMAEGLAGHLLMRGGIDLAPGESATWAWDLRPGQWRLVKTGKG